VAWYTVLLEKLVSGAELAKKGLDLAGSPVSTLAKSAGAPAKVVKALSTFESVGGGGGNTVNLSDAAAAAANASSIPDTKVKGQLLDPDLFLSDDAKKSTQKAGDQGITGGSGERSILPEPGSAMAQDAIDIENQQDGTDRQFASLFPVSRDQNILPTSRQIPGAGGGGPQVSAGASPEVTDALAAFDKPVNGGSSEQGPAPNFAENASRNMLAESDQFPTVETPEDAKLRARALTLTYPEFDNEGMGPLNEAGARETQRLRQELVKAGLDPSIAEFHNENNLLTAAKNIGRQVPLFGAAVPEPKGGSFVNLSLEQIMDGGPVEEAWNAMSKQERVFALFDGSDKGAKLLESNPAVWERVMGASSVEKVGDITYENRIGGIGGQAGITEPPSAVDKIKGALGSIGPGSAPDSNVQGAGGGVQESAEIPNTAPTLQNGGRARPQGGRAGTIAASGSSQGTGMGVQSRGRASLGPGEQDQRIIFDQRKRNDYTVNRAFGKHQPGDAYSATGPDAEGLIRDGFLSIAGDDPDAVINVRKIDPATGEANGPSYRTTNRIYRQKGVYDQYVADGDDVVEGIGPDGKRGFFSKGYISTISPGGVRVETQNQPRPFKDLHTGQDNVFPTNEELEANPGRFELKPTRTLAVSSDAVDRANNGLANMAIMRDILNGVEGLEPGSMSLQGEAATAVGRFLHSVGLGEMGDDLNNIWTGKDVADMGAFREKLKAWVNQNKLPILNDQRISAQDQRRLDDVISENQWFGSIGQIKKMVKAFGMYRTIQSELDLAAAGERMQFPVDTEVNFQRSLTLMETVGGLDPEEAEWWGYRMRQYPQLKYSGGQDRLDQNIQGGQ